MEDIGISGMVNTSLWCERVAGTQTLSLGKSVYSRNDCELELAGRFFWYWICARGTWVWISVREMDNSSPDPNIFFHVGDGPAGWTSCRRFVLALERSAITSLKARPIQLGEEGPDSFLIV